MKSGFYVALLHSPVYNKRMEVITTSITNLDLHDISRAARTYGVSRFYLIHPQQSQRDLAGEMLGYWREGFGGEYNPDRKEALDILKVCVDLDEAVADITALEGKKPFTVATDARPYPNSVGYPDIRDRIEEGEEPHIVLFGTGWGLTEESVKNCDYVLQPIESGSDYNHLSVRSAVAIILDRLLGDKWW